MRYRRQRPHSASVGHFGGSFQRPDEPAHLGPTVIVDDNHRQQRGLPRDWLGMIQERSIHASDLTASTWGNDNDKFTEFTEIKRRFGRWKSLRELR